MRLASSGSSNGGGSGVLGLLKDGRKQLCLQRVPSLALSARGKAPRQQACPVQRASAAALPSIQTPRHLLRAVLLNKSSTHGIFSELRICTCKTNDYGRHATHGGASPIAPSQSCKHLFSLKRRSLTSTPALSNLSCLPPSSKFDPRLRPSASRARNLLLVRGNLRPGEYSLALRPSAAFSCGSHGGGKTKLSPHRR